MEKKIKKTKTKEDISLREYNKWSEEFYQKSFLHFTILVAIVSLVLGLG